MAVALVLENPLKYDYHETVAKFLAQLDKTYTERIDIYSDEQPNDSQQLNTILTTIYSTIREEATKLGWDYTLQINFIHHQPINNAFYAKIYASSDVKDTPYTPVIANITERNQPHKTHPQILKHQYPVVACGGTFDHMHDGHKILISMAAFLTHKTLIVGITGPKLLQNKKYAEVLELFEQRKANVENFANLIIGTRNIDINVYEINDVCGPTGFISEIDALVVSEETVKGADFINNYRKEKNFPPLEVVVIDVIGDEESGSHNGWAGKLSSTDVREIVYNKRTT